MNRAVLAQSPEQRLAGLHDAARDLATRHLLGYSIGERHDAQLVVDARDATLAA